MAEVLGIVASGLSVAQIAGSIVTTSIKVKALLDEVKNAPDNLKDMLEYIELLAPILCEANTAGDEGAGTTNSLPLAATSHLRQALAKCQAASEQLELLARSLMSQMDAARGGVRRKCAMFKILLKRGTLSEYEKRLQKTIQLLSLAHDIYTFALYRSLPETIVAQLTSVLAESPQTDRSPTKMPHDQSPPQIHGPHTVIGRHLSSRKNGSGWNECWKLGFAKVTGLVRIHTSSRGEDYQTIPSAQNQFLRIQVQMPTWLCASVLDAVLSRSYAGWTCSLNMYGHILDDTVEFDLIADAILDDNVDAIHRLFQERRCGPLDWLVWDDGYGNESLFEYALRSSAWQACGYLLDYGAAQPDHAFNYRRGYAGEGSETHIEALITHNEIDEKSQMICLPYLCQDLKSFTGLIDRIWPYNEFYTAALEDERLSLAMSLSTNLDTTWNPASPAIFQHLCESSSLADAGSSTTTKVLSCIAWGLGNIVWKDQDVASKWYNAIRDTALRLDKALVMPEQQLLGSELTAFSLQLFTTPTPFTDMFSTSMHELPGYNSNRKFARQHKIESRLANCARAVQMWLNILQECGIDLLEYGRQERQRMKDQENGWAFRIWRDVWHEDPRTNNPNGQFEIRLIGFEYGKQPGDWKLWWSEPTDGLVGDFWKGMEPEPLCIPGSWDEDF